MISSDGTITASKCLFGDLSAGDQFIFEYEYLLMKDCLDKGFYPDKTSWQQMISAFIKNDEESYSNVGGGLIFDRRKFSSKVKIKGYCYVNTPVYKL